MALIDDLKRLARLPKAPTPFLSLYLDTRWKSEKERERVRIFVKTRLKECLSPGTAWSEEATRGLQEDAERINHYVRGLVNREWDEVYGGIAVFACTGAGVYEVVRSHLPFEDALACGSHPLLRPAAANAQAGAPELLAMVTGEGGGLVEFELGGVRRQVEFRDPEPPGHDDLGAGSQDRYQRYLEEHVQRNLRKLSAHLVKWVDERRVRRVVLGGSEPLLAAFAELLPKRVAAAVCGHLPLTPGAHPDEVRAAALTTLRDGRERDEAAELDALLEERPGTGRVVVGPGAVAEAVAAGRVRTIYLDRDFQETGWGCSACGALGLKVPLGCPGCDAAVETVALGEELLRGVLARDGGFVLLGGHAGLGEVGGVAAQVRYA